MTRLLRVGWLPMLIIAVATIACAAVVQLHAVFGSDPVLVAPLSSDSAESSNPKIVTYEVFGSGGVAVINYLDLDATPQRAVNAALPWSLTLRTTAPAATPSLLAQGNGPTITCRITVDGEIKDQRTATGADAETFCLVKSA